MISYQCMFNEAASSCLIKLHVWVGPSRLSNLGLLKVLLDSSQFLKDRMFFGIDTIEPKVRYEILAGLTLIGYTVHTE